MQDLAVYGVRRWCLSSGIFHVSRWILETLLRVFCSYKLQPRSSKPVNLIPGTLPGASWRRFPSESWLSPFVCAGFAVTVGASWNLAQVLFYFFFLCPFIQGWQFLRHNYLWVVKPLRRPEQANYRASSTPRILGLNRVLLCRFSRWGSFLGFGSYVLLVCAPDSAGAGT